MPRVAGSLLGVSLLLLLLGRAAPAAAPATAPPAQPVDWRFAAGAAALLAGAFALMAVAGYLPGTALAVCGFMLLGRTDWRTALACAALLPAVLWLVFSRLLGYPLP
jgi:hypothetical protein